MVRALASPAAPSVCVLTYYLHLDKNLPFHMFFRNMKLMLGHKDPRCLVGKSNASL